MPTKRTRRKRSRQGDIPTAAWYFLNDALAEALEEDIDQYDLIELQTSTYPHAELSALWNAYRDVVLKRWTLLHPGTRPHCWWLLDAPALPGIQHGRYTGPFCANELKEPRKRLSGIGTPGHEVLNLVPRFRDGVPVSWVTPFDVEYYNGRAKNIYGDLINPDAKEGDFKGVAIDPNNPPVFESQAAYLDRFGLLSATEKKKSNFNPESVFEVIGSHLKHR